MAHPKIKSAQALDGHVLLVQFDTLETKRYNAAPLLENAMFAPLRNPAFFKNVQVEPGGHAVYWNEDIDLSEYELWSKGETFAPATPETIQPC